LGEIFTKNSKFSPKIRNFRDFYLLKPTFLYR